MKKNGACLIPSAVVMTLLCLAVLFSDWFAPHRMMVAAALFGVCVIVLLCSDAVSRRREKERTRVMDAVFEENASIAAKLIRQVNVPCAMVDERGRIVWRNEIFKKIFADWDIRRIQPQFDASATVAAAPLAISGGEYQVMTIPVRRSADGRAIVFQYWLDRTEAAHYQRLFEEQMPYVALIYIDNFEELAANQQFHRTSVLTDVEKMVSDLTKSIDGIYRRYESGRFVLVFEAKHLVEMENVRFPILERAHGIDTGTSMAVSLSISIGAADRITLSDESARQAMELALGRGGDQAVVKRGANYTFYGGKRQVEAMQSRVKMRLFSKALRQLFENAGDVFIMGHERADMDCLGAALGVFTCARSIGSRAYIILPENNSTIERAMEMLQQDRAYADAVVTPEQAERLIRPNSVLVVVDTQRASIVAAPQLLTQVSRLVLIDHHRRNADRIENATLHFLESRASSASELVAELLQYFDDDLRPSAFVCGALLAGITMDTKHFAFNVGSRTFDAAAYLRRNGADIALVKQMFQDDMESYGDCANTVRGADIMQGGIAVAAVEDGVKNAKLIAAKAADELVGIRGIEAAFVIGREDGSIAVSGRSIGNVNAQVICESMGGGGHMTVAGAQLGEIDIEEAEARVRAAVDEYMREDKTK